MARRPLLASAAMLCLVLVLLVSPTRTVAASSSYTAMSYCRCTCFNKNSTIIPLYRPANPANPCLTCTRQFCLDQKLPACVGAQNPEEDPDTATGIGSDVEARCFQRDSPKSHFIVISFLVITSILLAIAGLKHYGIDLQAITFVAMQNADSMESSTGSTAVPINEAPTSQHGMAGTFRPDTKVCHISQEPSQQAAMQIRGGGCAAALSNVRLEYPSSPTCIFRGSS
ncbi:hypothetical protein B0A53_04133 [Rhodotorula sp. CCFEE 5036]|nr:hypothetical protein B0A53_04133 [Rhodotorula sp. CCFEE 5036]